MPVTQEQVSAAIQTIKALADAIQSLGQVPSGELYANVMGHISLRDYEKTIDLLVKAELVERKANLLTWIGPAKVEG